MGAASTQGESHSDESFFIRRALGWNPDCGEFLHVYLFILIQVIRQHISNINFGKKKKKRKKMLKINFARDAWGFNLLWIGEKRVRLFWKIVKIVTEGQGKAESEFVAIY